MSAGFPFDGRQQLTVAVQRFEGWGSGHGTYGTSLLSCVPDAHECHM